MKKDISKRITVILEHRDDGGLRVRSKDLPGLILSHSDAAKCMADILPAWKVLVDWGRDAGPLLPE